MENNLSSFERDLSSRFVALREARRRRELIRNELLRIIRGESIEPSDTFNTSLMLRNL